MPTPSPLATHIERHRIFKASIARAVGVSQTTVSNWCSGRLRPHPRNQAKLQQAIGLPVIVWGGLPSSTLSDLNQAMTLLGAQNLEETIAKLASSAVASGIPCKIEPRDGDYRIGEPGSGKYAFVIVVDDTFLAKLEPMSEDAQMSESDFLRTLVHEECELSLHHRDAYDVKVRKRAGASTPVLAPHPPPSDPPSEDDLLDQIEDPEELERSYLTWDFAEPDSPYERIIALGAIQGLRRSTIATKAGIKAASLYTLGDKTKAWRIGGCIGEPPGVRPYNAEKFAAALKTTRAWIETGEDEDDPIDRETNRTILTAASSRTRPSTVVRPERSTPRQLNDLEKRMLYVLEALEKPALLVLFNSWLPRGRLCLARGRLRPLELDQVSRLCGGSREWIQLGVGVAPSKEQVKEAFIAWVRDQG